MIAADGITLDLNGHLVDGDGTPAADCDQRKEPCDLGVFNDGHDGVTVMHGSVREFAVGVLFGTAGGRARDNRGGNTAHGNENPMQCTNIARR